MHYDPLPMMTIVALSGVTILVVRGSVFGFLRRASFSRTIRGLFSCALCFGFWVGLAWGISTRHSAWALLDGCTIALAALFADAVLVKLLGDK